MNLRGAVQTDATVRTSGATSSTTQIVGDDELEHGSLYEMAPKADRAAGPLGAKPGGEEIWTKVAVVVSVAALVLGAVFWAGRIDNKVETVQDDIKSMRNKVDGLSNDFNKTQSRVDLLEARPSSAPAKSQTK